ncbi:MAG: hypothetical protein JJE07_02295 [Flavobacteriaceae bacterium]|nr:hypothetical protein [Flavobacteriaceae bacterium]
MNVHEDLKWIQDQLNDITDPDLIAIFKSLLKYKNKKAEGLTLAEYNRELDEAENEIESGNYYTQEEAQKIASQWGRK